MGQRWLGGRGTSHFSFYGVKHVINHAAYPIEILGTQTFTDGGSDCFYRFLDGNASHVDKWVMGLVVFVKSTSGVYERKTGHSSDDVGLRGGDGRSGQRFDGNWKGTVQVTKGLSCCDGFGVVAVDGHVLGSVARFII